MSMSKRDATDRAKLLAEFKNIAKEIAIDPRFKKDTVLESNGSAGIIYTLIHPDTNHHLTVLVRGNGTVKASLNGTPLPMNPNTPELRDGLAVLQYNKEFGPPNSIKKRASNVANAANSTYSKLNALPSKAAKMFSPSKMLKEVKKSKMVKSVGKQINKKILKKPVNHRPK